VYDLYEKNNILLELLPFGLWWQENQQMINIV